MFKKYLTVLSGTVVEYYDYSLYGFTAIYIAATFFPESDPDLALLRAFMVFALGSIAKPLGAFTFSHLGDYKGRKPALRWTMLGIVLPTLVIGVLPSYETWGYSATLVLILCRFLQGFLLSSEYDGAAIYIQEHISSKYACLGNSLLGISFSLGILLASLVSGWCILHFSAEWGWRIPYLIGGLLGIISFFARRSIVETPQFEKSQKIPLKMKEILTNNWRAVLSAALICGGSGAIYQFAIIFWPTFMRDSIHTWDEGTIYQTSIALTLYTFIKPLIGYTADKLGSEKFLCLGACLFATAVVAMLIDVQLEFYSLWTYYGVVATIPFYGICGHVVLTQYISVKERYRCINIGHSLGSMAFSGTTPAIAMWLWTSSGEITYPIYYLLIFAPFTIVGLALLKYRNETAQFRYSTS